jgi:hypothetical protein
MCLCELVCVYMCAGLMVIYEVTIDLCRNKRTYIKKTRTSNELPHNILDDIM